MLLPMLVVMTCGHLRKSREDGLVNDRNIVPSTASNSSDEKGAQIPTSDLSANISAYYRTASGNVDCSSIPSRIPNGVEVKVIHIENRIDRAKHISESVEPLFRALRQCLNWTWEVFPAVTEYPSPNGTIVKPGIRGAVNCLASHRNAFRKNSQASGPGRYVLMLEDDVFFEVMEDDFIAALSFIFESTVKPSWDVIKLEYNMRNYSGSYTRNSEGDLIFQTRIPDKKSGLNLGSGAYVATPLARDRFERMLSHILVEYEKTGNFTFATDAMDAVLMRSDRVLALVPRVFGMTGGWSDVEEKQRQDPLAQTSIENQKKNSTST